MNPFIPALRKRLPLWALGAICVAILAPPASAATPGKMRVTPHPDGTVELTLERASLRQAAGVLSLRIGVPVMVEAPDREVSRRIARATPEEALDELVRSEGLVASREKGRIVIREGGSEPVVTIDVKDGEIASILREVATQCGIRNLVLDREVQGKGTFLFRDVPCEAAFRAIFTSMGLAADRELNSLIHVRTQR
ncbi:MAG: STN domain-containing protein [Thermoanaerobaculia bacterium]